MKTNCEYCGSVINDHDEKCPSCGATNAHYLKTAPKQPKTIEELKLWYTEKNFPPEEVTRFFIGKDIKEAKAFGIYKDEEHGTFVVYKNKADGTRAVRYDGADEEYAVNELFQKLREEASKQKARNVANRSGSGSPKPRQSRKDKLKSAAIPAAIITGIMGLGIYSAYSEDQARKQYFIDHPEYNKYYEYDDNYYYNLDGDYYYYDDYSNDWEYYGSEAPFDEDKYQKYTLNADDIDDFDFSDFEKTSYYDNWYDDFYDKSDSNGGGYNNDDDWDSGWDGGDWDSGGGDWDSDW